MKLSPTSATNLQGHQRLGWFSKGRTRGRLFRVIRWDDSNLFLDTHPSNDRALELMREYRKLRKKAVAKYEMEYGPLNRTAKSTEISDRWKWIDGPWPWEYCAKED